MSSEAAKGSSSLPVQWQTQERGDRDWKTYIFSKKNDALFQFPGIRTVVRPGKCIRRESAMQLGTVQPNRKGMST